MTAMIVLTYLDITNFALLMNCKQIKYFTLLVHTHPLSRLFDNLLLYIFKFYYQYANIKLRKSVNNIKFITVFQYNIYVYVNHLNFH